MQIFRKMNENDIEEVAAMEARIFSDAWTSKSIYDTYCQRQAFITVAETDGKISGYCIIYYVLEEGEIARIAVNPDEQHKGVGRGLLDYTSEICRQKGISRLLLDVRKSNTGARKFYEKYGFSEDGIRKHFYENPAEDAVLMSKSIG